MNTHSRDAALGPTDIPWLYLVMDGEFVASPQSICSPRRQGGARAAVSLLGWSRYFSSRKSPPSSFCCLPPVGWEKIRLTKVSCQAVFLPRASSRAQVPTEAAHKAERGGCVTAHPTLGIPLPHRSAGPKQVLSSHFLNSPEPPKPPFSPSCHPHPITIKAGRSQAGSSGSQTLVVRTEGAGLGPTRFIREKQPEGFH